MIQYLAGVATGFVLIGLYGFCVREWDNGQGGRVLPGEPYVPRVEPWWVRWWYYFFAGGF